jgi:choice-of-anchor A domain-containing protein
MSKRFPSQVVASLFCLCAACHAAPFGAASAFNLVALGTVNGGGGTVIAGNIGTSADVEGRIAAANDVTQASTVGATLGSDPWGSLADGYAIVAGGGVTANSSININGGGNVYAPTNSAHYNWNETPQGVVVSTGPGPINFTGLRTSLDDLTLQLAALTSNGVTGAPTPPGGNPSWLVLSGTSTTLNVFTVTAAQFSSSNHPLDISVPTGSTVIINVEGANVSLGAGIYFNGQQEGDSNNDNGDILFNFSNASTVSIDGQLDGAVLAPFAVFTSDSQVGGNIIAAQVGLTGEVHNIEFDGTLPSPSETPEPGTISLLGTGLLFIACLAGSNRRRHQLEFQWLTGR